MYHNVPEKLHVYVRDHISRFIDPDGNRGLMYIAAAGAVIREYTGREVFALTQEAFYDANLVSDANMSFIYQSRVCSIAESLFSLRSCKGFPEICRRMRTRDIRPAYHEMMSAKQFFKAGFDINMRPEINVLGEDFDFTAELGENQINVEVTALEEKSFRSSTVMRALNRKREQLPKTNPSVIVCVLPERWGKEIPNLNSSIGIISKRFLAQTKRVNVLIFRIENHIPMNWSGSTGSTLTIFVPFSNTNPAYHYDFNFLFEGHLPSSYGRQMVGLAAGSKEAGDAIAQHFRQGVDFYEWVDSLVPR